MTHQIENLLVNGSPMEVFVFEPEGKGPFPALMQCMHIPVGHTGIENDEFTLRTAERYRDNGYVVLVPFIVIFPVTDKLSVVNVLVLELYNKLLSVFCVLDKLDFTKYSISSILDIPIQYYYLIQLFFYSGCFWECIFQIEVTLYPYSHF